MITYQYIVDLFSLSKEKNPLLMISLILAFNEKKTKLQEVALYLFYELKYTPNEEKLPIGFSDFSSRILKTINLYDDKLCYFEGYAGNSVMDISNLNSRRKEFIIRSRILRTFHGVDVFDSVKYKSNNSRIVFFCIVGLKGSGKSTILEEISKHGYSVVEIYRKLSSYKHCLPSPELWTTEPLEISLKYIDINSKYIFIGSLLRPEELLFLNNIGDIRIIEVKTENNIRYKRLLKRGRVIEKKIESLVNLDLNRYGYSVGYESNDLGFWLSKAKKNIINYGSIDDIVEKILLYVEEYENVNTI